MFDDEMSKDQQSTGLTIAFIISLLSILIPLLTPWVKYYIKPASEYFEESIIIVGTFWSFVTFALCVVALIIIILIIGDAESVAGGRGRTVLYYISILQILSCVSFFMFDYPRYNQYTNPELGIGYWISIIAAISLFLTTFIIPKE